MVSSRRRTEIFQCVRSTRPNFAADGVKLGRGDFDNTTAHKGKE